MCLSLLLALQKWQLVVLVILYLVYILPQLHRYAVIFSPLEFLCILLLEETFVQVLTAAKGLRSQPVSFLPERFHILILKG